MKFRFFFKAFFILILINSIYSENENLVLFDFHGKRLDDLLQKIAEIKNINILLPQEISKNDNLSIDEIQIDCDWTDITRKAYFEFLSKLIILSQNKQVMSKIYEVCNLFYDLEILKHERRDL